MSDRKPHVTDVELGVISSRASTDWELMTMVRDEYEAKVAKDAELIQMAVKACSDPHQMSLGRAFLAAAEAHGFKPTEP